jgi:hypothetical protein
MPIALKDQLRPYPVTSGTLRHSSGSFELFFYYRNLDNGNIEKKNKNKNAQPSLSKPRPTV